MAEAKILDSRTAPSLDPVRKGKLDRIITYQTDPLHTFVLFLPDEASSDAQIEAAIKKDQERRSQIVGRVIKL